MYSPKHSAARKRHPLRNRTVGVAIATTSAFGTGVAITPTAQAAGSVWDRVAACESSGNWAISTGNGYFGGLQFSASTWNAFGGLNYAPSANRASKSAQIAVASQVLGAQGPGAWPKCGRVAGLGKANGAAAGPVAVSRSQVRVTIHPRGRVVIGAHARLVVDGELGPRTVRQIQRWVGPPQNGVLGATTVSALQRKVGAYPDGTIGRRTIYTLQTRLGIGHDHSRHLNVRTVAALQRYLNRH